MSDAADRVLAVLATEVQSAIILDTGDVRAVCLRVKELEAELEKFYRVRQSWIHGFDRATNRLDRMRKAFKRVARQLREAKG